MKKTAKLFSGPMWKPKSTGPFHEDRNHYRWLEDLQPHRRVPNKKILMGIGVITGLAFITWSFEKIHNHNRKERPFTLNAENTKARKAKEIAMGWWQETYWKKGDAIYLPTASDSDWFGDSPSDWPVERALAYLDDDEWWDNFEATRPKGWVNILPDVLSIFNVKKKSVESAEEEEEGEEEGEEGEEEEEAKDSFFLLPYNSLNPTSPLPSQRPEYRRVLEIIHEGFPRKGKDVPDPYTNVLGGCTAIIDPDGPKPVKVTFSNDWRDLSPELLKLIRERLVWKYKDDLENYAPPQLSSILKEKWEDRFNVEINQEK